LAPGDRRLARNSAFIGGVDGLKQISPGILLIGFFAILIGLAGAYVVKRALSTPAPQPVATPVEKPLAVVLAAIDLQPGRIIRSGDIMNMQLTQAQFRVRKWPPVMLNDAKQVIGRMVQRPIGKGKPFEPDSFYPEGTGPDFAARLAPGLRAVTVLLKTDALPSKAAPSSLVDVIFRAAAAKDASIPEVTQVLMQDVEILAIGDNSTPGIQGGIEAKEELHPITLAVSAEQAMKLKVAEGHGELSLALRNPEDRARASSISGLTLREMLSLPPISQPFVAEIYRGGQRQTLTFLPKGGIVEHFGGSPVQKSQPADDPKDPDMRGAPGKPANQTPAPTDDPAGIDTSKPTLRTPRSRAPQNGQSPAGAVSQIPSGLDGAGSHVASLDGGRSFVDGQVIWFREKS
jgi:pilus assembly protein CpaB